MSSLNTQIRKDIVSMVYNANSGHIGGSLSLVEIMHTLYFKIMNIDPKNPKMDGRDIFIMSKGHASAVLYSTLAHRGFFPTDELLTFRKLGSRLQGHPSKKNLECIEASTGSLGQGVCIALGAALGYKLDKKDARVFVVAGDGEAQEGTFWESAMAAANYKLDMQDGKLVIVKKAAEQTAETYNVGVSNGDDGTVATSFITEVTGGSFNRIQWTVTSGKTEKFTEKFAVTTVDLTDGGTALFGLIVDGLNDSAASAAVSVTME